MKAKVTFSSTFYLPAHPPPPPVFSCLFFLLRNSFYLEAFVYFPTVLWHSWQRLKWHTEMNVSPLTAWLIQGFVSQVSRATDIVLALFFALFQGTHASLTSSLKWRIMMMMMMMLGFDWWRHLNRWRGSHKWAIWNQENDFGSNNMRLISIHGDVWTSCL